jgi:hypothetical protein
MELEQPRREDRARQLQESKSQEVVEARVRATLKNVLLEGRRPNLCIIKDVRGRTLSAVADNRPKAAKPRATANARA